MLVVLLSVAVSAHAQTPQQQGFRPLDQIIEDQDPLRHSLRRVQQGIGFTGQESYVYTRPGESRIYYIRPGIVASFDRSEYFQLQDGPLLQMIPPNTIFYLGSPPPPSPGIDQHRPPSRLMLERQVNGRIGPAPRHNAALDLPHADAMSRYFTWRRLHRQALVDAIDRTIAQEVAEQDAAPSP